MNTGLDKIENRVKKMSRGEAMRLFESYGFVDSHGHPLINCVDFLHLIELALHS